MPAAPAGMPRREASGVGGRLGCPTFAVRVEPGSRYPRLQREPFLELRVLQGRGMLEFVLFFWVGFKKRSFVGKPQ